MYTDGLIEFNRNRFDGEARLLTADAESLQLRCNAEYLATFIANRVQGNAHTSIDVADFVALALSF